MYTSMLDEQFAQKIAQGGTGLADVIARQLSRNLGTPAPGSAPDTAAAAGAPAGVPAPAAGLLRELNASATLRGRR